MIGRTLGHYRIVEPLGAGGMGEVYRAHDEKLDRDVALKVLPEGALSDPEARKRFQREANALSRLSHPHIATIHDFDTADGMDFLVMELVKGPSLRDELEDKGALPGKTVVRLGAQLARGLQAAHEQGIVHRDLKPGNLQLTPDGLLKILDFGLARLLPKETPGDETAPTQTAVGRIAGTLLYMSPEQLRGRGVDARTDLYAAGAVLYEMATGRRLFSKASSAELTEAILGEDPTPPREVNERISPGLEQVILKALDKDPELRYQTAKDLHIDLERLQLRSDSHPSGSESAAARAAGAHVRKRWRWGGSLAALASVLAGGIWLFRAPAPPRVTEMRRLHVDVGPEYAGGFYPIWATDGVRVYYTVSKETGLVGLFQTALGGGEPAEIVTPFETIEIHGYLQQQSALVVLASETSEPAEASIGFPVWLVPLPRGAPRRIGNVRAQFVAVSPDEEHLALLLYGRLSLVDIDGSNARDLLELPERVHAGWLRWSPDGRRLRYAATAPADDEGGPWIWETSLEGEDPRPLWPGDRGEWTSDGRYFLIESGNSSGRSDIWAVREKRWLSWAGSEPTQLTLGPVSFRYPGSRPGGDGLLALGRDPRGEAHRLDRRTRRLEPLLGGESVEAVASSPDGSWLVWVTFPEGALWRSRPDGSQRLRLTHPPERAYWPAWSPDGTRIAFLGRRPDHGGWSVRLVSVDGSSIRTVMEATSGASYWDVCWLPDGESLLFSESNWRRAGLYQANLTAKQVEVLGGGENLVHPKCGPQGQVLATLPRVEDAAVVMTPQAYSPGTGTWNVLEPLNVGFSTWTRDGGAFCGLRFPGWASIDCYSMATGRSEPLADLGKTPLLIGTTGSPWFALDPDDNPLIVLDRSTRDFYALEWEAP